MQRRDFLRTIGAGATGLALGGLRAGAAAAGRPNIVLIMADDLGYGDIGPFGSTLNRTPQLDRMAREGLRLTSFYAAPVCSVSRAQVITGCYGQRVSVPGVFPPGCPNGLNQDEHTVAELLRDQGYATMCIGKWHLGDQPPFLPTHHGFDRYFGLPYSNDMIKKAKVNGQPVVPLMRDDQVAELLTGEGQDQLTERYTDEACKFITAHQTRPFFLYFPHTAVHVPIHPGAQFRDKSRNGRYGDWVEELDASVGRVLQTLRDLRLADNTLVIFTSDNGPWLSHGKDAGTAGPLRGGKGSTWEGGVREPTVAWWPGRIAAGGTCDAVAGNIDWLPTFVRLGGGTVPTDRQLDGANILPNLLGESQAAQRPAHYYYNGYSLQAVRVGPWKLAVAPQRDGMGNGGAAAPASLDRPRLYNLDTDLGERTDVAAAQPEVVARLKALVVAMAADLGDGRPGPGVRPAGRVDNPVTLYPTDDGPRGGGGGGGAKGTNAALTDLKLGDRRIGAEAPHVQGRALTIACEVETTAREGVLVAHGGSAVGYSLYLKDGHAVFAVHQGGEAVVRLTSPAALGPKASLEARLSAAGALALLVDGQPVATGKLDGPLNRQPVEAFCVGHDDGAPVDEYDGTQPFAGKLRNVRVSTAP